MPLEQKAPSFEELMWPALIAMKELGGSATHDELLEKVIEVARIPEHIQNFMHTERLTKVSYNLAWAKTYLGKVGALENPSHGVWAITQKGKGLNEQEVKKSLPKFVDNRRLRNRKRLGKMSRTLILS